MDVSKLLPDASAIQSFETWSDVLVWSKLSSDTWVKVAQALGEEGLEDFPTIAALGDSDYYAALELAKLNAIQRTRVNLAVNLVRARSGLQVSNITANVGANTPSTDVNKDAGVVSTLALANETRSR